MFRDKCVSAFAIKMSEFFFKEWLLLWTGPSEMYFSDGAQCMASHLHPCPRLHPLTTQFNETPSKGESMARITQCENVSPPSFLCWRRHLTWYQRGLRYSTSLQRQHAKPFYAGCWIIWLSERPGFILCIVLNTFRYSMRNSNMFSQSVQHYCAHLQPAVYLHWMLSLRDYIPPSHIFFTSPPPFRIPLHQPPPRPPFALSPRWPWGWPVWNVIGIIPFSLIASAGEQSYVSHRMPTKPVRTHFTHISHGNFLRAASHTDTRALVGRFANRAVQGPCAFLCLFVLNDNCSFFSDETGSQTSMITGACDSKWPHGKKGLIRACVCAHLP